MINLFSYVCVFLISSLLSIILIMVPVLTTAVNTRENGMLSGTEYECGFSSPSTTKSGHSIHYYRLMLLFLMFDLELLFLFPWPASSGLDDITGILMFFVIITFGFVYEW